MLSRKQVYKITDVPATWILETYLGVERLIGQTVRLPSPFAPQSTHRDPLQLYYNKEAGEYRFKCYSKGVYGRVVDLMMQYWNMSFQQAALKIEVEYQAWLNDGNRPNPTQTFDRFRWKVVAHQTRSWTQDDADFWSAYNVGSNLLEADLVRPLAEYSLLQFVGEEATENGFTTAGSRLYGYFSPEGELYKIYQPMNREQKYLKTGDYLQGLHSLQNHPYLCLVSGMKDMLALKSLKLRIDYLASSSENCLLGYEDLVDLKLHHGYQAIITLLDPDTTGLASMRNYHAWYGVPYVYLSTEMDAALSIKRLGASRVRDVVAPAIHRVIDQFSTLHPRPKETLTS